MEACITGGYVLPARKWVAKPQGEWGEKKNRGFLFVVRARFDSFFSALAKQTASYTSEVYGLNNIWFYLGLPEGRSW